MKDFEVLELEVNDLNRKIEYLNEKINMVDSYSQFFMSQTIGILASIIGIATFILGTAAYFMIKSMINSKIDNEVEKKVLKVLSNTNPIFHARGVNVPNNNNEIILPETIPGIEQLSPSTMMMLQTNVEHFTYEQIAKGLGAKFYINENGEKVIYIERCKEGQEIYWLIAWIREKY